jgi:hypothetical protein
LAWSMSIPSRVWFQMFDIGLFVKFPFLWTHKCVHEKFVLPYQLWEILVYTVYLLTFLSEFARLAKFYVIAESELFMLVVHCHSDVTYLKWSCVLSWDIQKLVRLMWLL